CQALWALNKSSLVSFFLDIIPFIILEKIHLSSLNKLFKTVVYVDNDNIHHTISGKEKFAYDFTFSVTTNKSELESDCDF
ncbi:MAG: hypothetical protein KJS45_11685, partial [Bacteroidetes bacterium]|nr:hypothetical protein [Bacteroidota bacterium]